MTVSRTRVKETLRRLNEAENSRSKVSVGETIARIDAVMAENVEGWHNGVHVSNREAERQGERVLFEAVADYHRDFERVIIDPPFAAFTWRITGTARGKALDILGCSVLEINDEGKVWHYWLYMDSAQLAGIFG
ncbi:MAG: hypothetical protein A2Z29_02730 [Chloroflexi bacterium RBG_16_56_11]|nr:MAG: hypothetical protein A2Z29_02730 [Chloroflexi bacterium RBG_16_56_11]